MTGHRGLTIGSAPSSRAARWIVRISPIAQLMLAAMSTLTACSSCSSEAFSGRPRPYSTILTW